MKFLGLIPARGGSKSIPHKNIVDLSGKPLLSYTIEAAQGSRHLDRVILSTDDAEIAEVGRSYGVEIPFMRPEELARDDTPSIEVVAHILDWLKENESWQPEAVVLLQPTSPLRTAVHIDEAVDLFVAKKADTVVSVIEVPHRFSPYSIMQLEDGYLRDFWTEDVEFDRYRRQEMPKLYARNGPAILVTKTDVILDSNSFYGSKVIPYIMREEVSIDIDNYHDLELASAIIENPVK